MPNLAKLPTWAGDELVHVVVETPRGARAKLTFDPGLKTFVLSKALMLGLHYPYDWGFIPSTRAEDGDPLDAMLIGRGPSVAGAVVEARLLGVLEVEQNRKDGPGRQRNDRLFLAPLRSGEEAGPADVLGLSERVRAELEDFFVWSTRWEKKELRFRGWKGIHEAETLLSKAERAARG